MNDTTLQDEVRAWVASRDLAALRQRLTELAVPETADILAELEPSQRAVAFRALPREYAAEVFAYMDPEEEEALLRDMADEETRRILADMAPDDRTERGLLIYFGLAVWLLSALM